MLKQPENLWIRLLFGIFFLVPFLLLIKFDQSVQTNLCFQFSLPPFELALLGSLSAPTIVMLMWRERRQEVEKGKMTLKKISTLKIEREFEQIFQFEKRESKV